MRGDALTIVRRLWAVTQQGAMLGNGDDDSYLFKCLQLSLECVAETAGPKTTGLLLDAKATDTHAVEYKTSGSVDASAAKGVERAPERGPGGVEGEPAEIGTEGAGRCTGADAFPSSQPTGALDNLPTSIGDFLSINGLGTDKVNGQPLKVFKG